MRKSPHSAGILQGHQPEFEPWRLGGGRTRARTWDPLIKSQLLYQLSYAPGKTAPAKPCKSRSCSKAIPRCPAMSGENSGHIGIGDGSPETPGRSRSKAPSNALWKAAPLGHGENVARETAREESSKRNPSPLPVAARGRAIRCAQKFKTSSRARHPRAHMGKGLLRRGLHRASQRIGANPEPGIGDVLM